MPLFPKIFLITAAIGGGSAVVLGAFGAHALKAQLGPQALATWQTAVQYQFVHSLALLAVTLLALHSGRSLWLNTSALTFAAGILLFSGSLYCLALGGPRWLGPITPLGGLLFIAGWIALLVQALRG